MESGVVVGYDQTPSSERALVEAAAEADRRGVALTLVHASHNAPAEAADRVRADHPDLTVLSRVIEGSAPDVLADQSSEADVLVVGHRGHDGFLHPRSVALRTVARAMCPALVVRGSEHQTRGTVIAAVDVDDDSEELLDFAFTEAASRGARLKAVSAPAAQWPRFYARRVSGDAVERVEEELEQLLESWPDRYPDVVTDHERIEGSPTAFLTGATTYADLIVVGAHRRADGRHGMKLGPVAKTLLQHADCPVAVVPHG